MDKIRIENLEIFAKHGVFPEENFLGQKFVLSAVLHTDTRKAGLTDELSYSVHYGEVSHLIKKVVEENTWKLLETVAEATAKAILLSYPMVSQVDLTIKKPWAPIGLPLDTVSVEISRGWHTAYIALGSNMGDKEKYLNEAVEKLQQPSDCQVLKVSDFLVTAPYGGVEQDDFLNGALALKTLLTPQELLERLHEIEQEAHRERLIHWGPRTLDLDILLEKYGTEIPVIVAGGIYNREDVQKVDNLGADGIQVATRFITTEECDADIRYKEAHLKAKESDIAIVKSPVGMPGRAIMNKFMTRVMNGEQIPHSPCHGCLVKCSPKEIPYCITDGLINAVKGNVDEGLLFCGAKAWKAEHLQTVQEVINDLF